MNKWAAASKYDCNFLCVCVLGDKGAVKLSREMGQQMKLTHCVNGFIDDQRGMPEYGQLGCQGFIVLDEAHRVISKATSPFMEVRDLAFKHVEALLDAVCSTPKRALPLVCPGEFVTLCSDSLRGEQGVCVGMKDQQLQVALIGKTSRGKVVQVPASAVKKANDDSDNAGNGDSDSGGCGPGGCGPGGCGPSPGGCGPGGCAPGAAGSEGGCKPGGCGDGPCAVAQDEPLDAAFLEQMLDLDSTNVEEMDDEHDECVAALRTLAKDRSVPSLRFVLSCFTEHFAHEEELFEEIGFGEHQNERFSAKRTHAVEHTRILEIIRKELKGCSGDKVPTSFVKKILEDFHQHTSLYDKAYADFVAEQSVAL